MNLFRTAVGFIFLNYLAFAGFLYFLQDTFIYHPTPDMDGRGLPVREFRTTPDVIIKAFVVNPGHDRVVLYFGGNAEAVVFSAIDFNSKLKQRSAYFINYRGYGGSTGSPSEARLYHDALFIFDELRQNHRDIAVIGRSLGSGVATFLASKRKISKLVLITPFDSIANVAHHKFPFIPMRLVLKDQFDSLGRVADIVAPVLILMAENDQVIESWSTNNLINAFPMRQRQVRILLGRDHNSISRDPAYLNLIIEFLSSEKNK